MSARAGAMEDWQQPSTSAAEDNQAGPSSRQPRPGTPVRGHRKSSSWNSPPPPPFDFNPPPDFAPLAAAETSSSGGGGIGTPLLHSTAPSDLGSPTAAPVPASPSIDAADDLLTRPQIRAIQRLSTDSVYKSGHSSRSSSGKGGSSSDGGDVLAARRDELVSHLLTGDLLPGAGTSTPDIRPGSPVGGQHELPYVVNPSASSSSSSSSSTTSPILSLQVPDDERAEAQAWGVPRPRSSSRSEDSVHAWDSVWPAANAPHIVNLPPDAGASRFPLAPMSPYVTPSFSPAVVQTTRRLSTSPPPSPAPRLYGSELGLTLDHQQQQRPGSSSHRGLQQARGGASGFLSSSRSESASSQQSPSSSPRLIPVVSPPQSASTSSSPDSSVSSGSPTAAGSRRRSFASSGQPSSIRSQASPSTPPPGQNNSPRLRGERSSSFFSNQFPELAPPFISRKELLNQTSKLTRRSSETAISRPRPNASSLCPGSLTMSAVLPPPMPMETAAASSSQSGPFLSPLGLTRPMGPRRAISAQETPGCNRQARQRLAGLDVTPENSPGSSSGSHTQGSNTPPIPPLPSPPAPIPPELRPGIMLDDSALEDDGDEPEPEETDRRDFRIEPPTPIPRHVDDQPGGLVDEGDMLPVDTGVIDADVTFDDEGLTTLERIFLLSRSEYSFHRAYVARVLGDLLGDVDPCEAVEYVLPLLSGFSLDEDDTVKEAFAADLHRILWYFFSTCQLGAGEFTADDEDAALLSEGSVEEGFWGLPESIAGLERAIRTPQHLEVPRANEQSQDSKDNSNRSSQEMQRTSDEYTDSVRSNIDTLGFGSTPQTNTPPTNLSVSLSSIDNEWPSSHVALDMEDKPWAGSAVERVDPPLLGVGFFRPLLGTLLLSHNPSIADPVRGGIIAIIDRLREYSEPTVEVWGAGVNEEQPKHRTFLSQTGPHRHTMPNFDADARRLVEDELLHCVVLGMGKLSTDVPESLFDNSVEVVGGSEEDYDRERDEELYREQMIHEATLGRALSLSFIGSICEMYSPDEVLAYGFVDEVVRGLDGDPTTRAEAALAMSYVAKAAPEECIESLLSVFKLYAEDVDDQVRQSACTCLPALCKRIKELPQRREFAVTHVTAFVQDTENTRYAALEALGEVIYSFHEDPEGPPQQLITIYCDDEKCVGKVDDDWDVVASFNFPGVCLTLGPKGWSNLRELFHRMVDRAGERVFRTVAAFLHEVANILEPEQVAEDVLPVYRKCLAQGDDIRERIFEHIDVLVRSLPRSLGWMSFCRLSDAWKEDALGGWRAREQLALHIPSFLETFRGHPDVAKVLNITRSALLDPFAAVRDAATFAVPRTYEILQDSSDLAQKFYDTLLSLSTSQRYRQRVTFVRCLREFMRPPPNRKAFEQFFVPALMRLARDVVDVRLALATALADLFIVGAFYGDKAVPVPEEIKQIIIILSEDEAVDVRRAVIDVGADHWSKATNTETAGKVLEDKLESSDNPLGLDATMVDALAPEAAEAAQVKPVHDRAALASPALPDDAEDESALMALEGRDPFEMSFARAASVASLASLASAASARSEEKSE